MYVPCDTCRDRGRCYRSFSVYREACLAFAEGKIVECPEYKEAVYDRARPVGNYPRYARPAFGRPGVR